MRISDWSSDVCSSDLPPLPLERALEEINQQLRAWKTQLQFEIDPDVHQVVVSIVDSETGDKIRTIPSEALLRIARMIVQMQGNAVQRSEEHTSELQSLMRISYAVFCLKKKTLYHQQTHNNMTRIKP